MSEVALLQLIGLCVVGTGILILLFIKAMFVRVLGFVIIMLGVFTLIALGVPQMASLPPAVESFDIASVKTPDDLASIGQKIFFSKGQCALCHSIGPSESARCPDLAGIGAKLAPEFIYESLTQPGLPGHPHRQCCDNHYTHIYWNKGAFLLPQGQHVHRQRQLNPGV